LYLFVIFLVTKPIGVFMTRVFNREKTFLDPIFRPVEKLVYRLTGVDENREMRWTEYAVAMLLFSGVSMAVLYLIERTQNGFPSIHRNSGTSNRDWRSAQRRRLPPTPTGKFTPVNRR